MPKPCCRRWQHTRQQLLGAWSFVLIPADDWKALVRGQGGDPVSPAFSLLDQRMTLLDSSLFVAAAGRNKELLVRFGVVGPALVDLAVTHEMGHGICHEKNERRADDYGRALRQGKTSGLQPEAGWQGNNSGAKPSVVLEPFDDVGTLAGPPPGVPSDVKTKGGPHRVRLRIWW